MNMGGRIKERIQALGIKQKDLLDRIPDMSPQALSNIIRRDSVRSEWDQAIAEAIGVSVLWLVYGVDDIAPPDTSSNGASHQPTHPPFVAAILADLAKTHGPEERQAFERHLLAESSKWILERHDKTRPPPAKPDPKREAS